MDEVVKRGFLEEEALKMGLEGCEGWGAAELLREPKAWAARSSVCAKSCQSRGRSWSTDLGSGDVGWVWHRKPRGWGRGAQVPTEGSCCENGSTRLEESGSGVSGQQLLSAVTSRSLSLLPHPPLLLSPGPKCLKEGGQALTDLSCKLEGCYLK